jgi:hypothetical protein
MGEEVNYGTEREVRSGAGVDAPGREVDAPTEMSLLSTNLVDYGYLTPRFAPCQPPPEDSPGEPRRSRPVARTWNRPGQRWRLG